MKEVDLTDAPVHYNNEEACAWASGYNSALEANEAARRSFMLAVENLRNCLTHHDYVANYMRFSEYKQLEEVAQVWMRYDGEFYKVVDRHDKEARQAWARQVASTDRNDCPRCDVGNVYNGPTHAVCDKCNWPETLAYSDF